MQLMLNFEDLFVNNEREIKKNTFANNYFN